MGSGSYREQIVIEQKSVTRDTYGAEVVSWVTFATVRASVASITGREFFASAQVQSTVTAKIGIRWLDGVTTVMRVSYDSKLFNIVAVLDSYRNVDLMLLCEEVART